MSSQLEYKVFKKDIQERPFVSMSTTPAAIRKAVMSLTQGFYFEAAHTLERAVDADASRRIHGHTYDGEVTVRGVPDGKSGMVVDLAVLRLAIESTRDKLDHRFLDEVQGLSVPTLEGLCAFIATDLYERFGDALVSVRVGRKASGDSCLLSLG